MLFSYKRCIDPSWGDLLSTRCEKTQFLARGGAGRHVGEIKSCIRWTKVVEVLKKLFCVLQRTVTVFNKNNGSFCSWYKKPPDIHHTFAISWGPLSFAAMMPSFFFYKMFDWDFFGSVWCTEGVRLVSFLFRRNKKKKVIMFVFFRMPTACVIYFDQQCFKQKVSCKILKEHSMNIPEYDFFGQYL